MRGQEWHRHVSRHPIKCCGCHLNLTCPTRHPFDCFFPHHPLTHPRCVCDHHVVHLPPYLWPRVFIASFE